MYSDSAIQTCLMLRAAFKLALRQAEGLMSSIMELLGCELAVPIIRPSAGARRGSSRSPQVRFPRDRCTCLPTAPA